MPVINQSFVHNSSVGIEIFDNSNSNTVVPVLNQKSAESNITPRLNVTSANVIEGGIGDVDNNVEDDYDSGDDLDFNSSDGDNEDSHSSADMNGLHEKCHE